MIFNSYTFIIFFCVVYLIFWKLKNRLNLQNIFIIASSYFFYGWWDWRFLGLIIFSSTVDYFSGIKIFEAKNPQSKKIFLSISLFANLGLLGFFKYYNFFIESIHQAFLGIGYHLEYSSLNIILPVGISFYTFQTLSYSIDIYKDKLKPTKNPISFFAFVSFFPQLVAGPIERASNLLGQFEKKKTFNYEQSLDGLRQILWGFFKKIVIADNCAMYANAIFENQYSYSGSTLLLGAIFFSFQIYGDFSGYSDIAIGTSKLLGFKLMKNFSFPYFSRNIAEFWRRWHISLSSWFKDYLYIPLGGNRKGLSKTIRNTFAIFLVSGFWHGANWTFIAWGFIHASYFFLYMPFKPNYDPYKIVAHDRTFPKITDIFRMSFTFFIVCLAWVFFRSKNITEAMDYISIIFSKSLFSIPFYDHIKLSAITIVFVIMMIIIEWIGRRGEFALEHFKTIKTGKKLIFKHLSYASIVIAISYFYGINQKFIYFDF